MATKTTMVAKKPDLSKSGLLLAAGREAGSRWAANGATRMNLRKLRRLADSQEGIGGMLLIYDNGVNHGIAEGLFRDLHTEDEADKTNAAAFWADVLDMNEIDALDTIDDEFFALGFCEGALDA